jgi:site-specific DNA-adenine methylase
LEPFVGGAAVLFRKPRATRETLNDLDSRVMRFWPRAARPRRRARRSDRYDAVLQGRMEHVP